MMRSRKKSKSIWKHENELTTTQKLWDTTKAVLSREFVAIQDYLRKIGKSQISDLNPHLKGLE